MNGFEKLNKKKAVLVQTENMCYYIEIDGVQVTETMEAHELLQLLWTGEERFLWLENR